MLTVHDISPNSEAGPFPADGPLMDQLGYVLQYTESAAELFGTRPWNVSVAGDGIEVRLSCDPRLKKVDNDGRESVIAAGSAVFLLRLALRCHLMEPQLEFKPDYKQPNLLARLQIVGRATPSPEELELFSLLTGNKGEVPSSPPLDVLAPDFQYLRSAAAEEGASLRYVENEFLRTMTASMMQAGDHLHYHREQERAAFRAWLGVRSECEQGSSEFVNWFVFPKEIAEFAPPTNAEARVQPALAVLCTNHDDERNWLNTGQALGRLQLAATALGMQFAIFNQPLQVPGMRARFARETGFCNFPQVIVRVSFDATAVGDPRNAYQAIRRSASLGKQPCECGCNGDCDGSDHEDSRRH